MPLLHFFGGIGNNAVGTRTDPAETERVPRIIEQILGEQNAGRRTVHHFVLQSLNN
jgi:hypothetical protein